MEVSVCIIVKNDAQALLRCLKSIHKYAFEIVVVDTGSTDESMHVAKQYTNQVFEFAWCDDFAKAKNYAISKAKNDMVLILDSDEWIEALDEKEFKEMILLHANDVGRIQRRNLLNKNGIEQENQEWINRIFSKSKFIYEGKIHEQIVSKQQNAYQTYKSPIRIGHTGYLGTEEKLTEKAKRNLKLLFLELEQKEDAYILYQIGKSYNLLKEPEEACRFFQKALSFDLDPKLEYVIDMVEAYGYALLAANRPKDALCFEQIADTFSDTADFHLLMGFIYMNNELFDEAISSFLKATTIKTERTTGAGSYLAYYNAAVVEECLGHVDNARDLYKKCGIYAPALQRLEVLQP